MITVKSNISVVIQAQLDEIRSLQANPDPILRTIALAVLPAMKKRVHVDGKDSTGGQVGDYSKGYMTVRTGNYKDAAKFKKGDKVGEFKTKKSEAKGEAGKYTERTITLNKKTGVFTGEDKVGTNRKVYNRSSDTMVIGSLTRQMENDMSVVTTADGYGIGYLNPDNFKKALYLDATYKKKILTQLTAEEMELVGRVAQDFTEKYLQSGGTLTPEQYSPK